MNPVKDKQNDYHGYWHNQYDISLFFHLVNSDDTIGDGEEPLGVFSHSS